MGFWSSLWDGIVNFFKSAWNAIKKFFVAIFNFAREVVNYFRNKYLNPNKHKPFIGDLNKILKENLKKAPERDAGIFRGVYNTQTDEIEDLTAVSANSLDRETKNIMGNDPLVLLT
ncbi:MAG: hypothetical protein K2H60_00430 [Muribaculaceae bacterium]|nr:hypothetical protein [Muribaculaceae bacterium]